MADNVFVSYISAHRDAIDAELAAAFALAPSAELKRYLYRPCQEFTARGGKRARPALVLMAAEACGGSWMAALPAAAAVEHFQTAALIHDDIADESLTRRGLPCLYVSEGTGLAINDGDLALVESFASIAEDERFSPAIAVALARELVAMMRRTVEGQALDLGWARDKRWDLAPADYLEMATLKSAHYSAATPLVMGALVAGAPEATQEALRAFGLKAGLAFQIQDDLLNLTGDAAAQGKDFRSDITEGKRTLVVLRALEQLDPAGRQQLVALLQQKATDPVALEETVSLIASTGALTWARQQAEALCQEALYQLDRANLMTGPALEALRAMPAYFIERRA